MPTVREIEAALFELAPREGTMEWDNVGHLLGNPAQEVERCMVALDITHAVAEEAIAAGCQLIISHHPIMNCKWSQVQTVRDDTFQGSLLTRLLRANVSAICMHTNLDVAEGGVNDVLAQALGIRNPEGFTNEGVCRCGWRPEPMALPEFVRFISRTLSCNGVRYADAGKPVYRVAVGGGACGEFEDAAISAGCDTFVTSDLSYHQFVDAKVKGINLIDAGHFPTENPVCGTLVSFLAERFPDLRIQKSVSHREAIQYYMEGE